MPQTQVLKLRKVSMRQTPPSAWLFLPPVRQSNTLTVLKYCSPLDLDALICPCGLF